MHLAYAIVFKFPTYCDVHSYDTRESMVVDYYTSKDKVLFYNIHRRKAERN